MNVIYKVTLENMKRNKRRTLITIIGVIISAAMIMAVATLTSSFINIFQQLTIEETGEWHIAYKNIEAKDIPKIEQDSNTKESFIIKEDGYAVLPESQNADKPYLFIEHFDAAALKKMPLRLQEGRFPETSDEIVLPKHLEENGGVSYHIGDVLTLEIGERYVEDDDSVLSQKDPYLQEEESFQGKEMRQFKVVGVIERPAFELFWSPGYTAISYIDRSELVDSDRVEIRVIANQLNSGIYQSSSELAEKLGIEKAEYNSELLRWFGLTEDTSVSQMLYTIAAIVIVIIILGSVCLIYNAFAISISERSRQMGILSSVGATKKQKRNSVFFEGIIVGMIAVPIGILCGIIGIAITLKLTAPLFQDMYIGGKTEAIKLIVTPVSIAAAVLISFLTIFISAYLPARRASHITPMEAIRQTKEIKLKAKDVKTSRLTRKIFGFEGELALKNLKRNASRYRTTILSLVVSIVLFISVSTFMEYLVKSYHMTGEMGEGENGFDLQLDVSLYENEGEEAVRKRLDVFQEIASLPEVKEYTFSFYSTAEAMVDRKFVNEEILSGYAADVEQIRYLIDIVSLDDESLNKYANSVGVNPAQLMDPDHPQGIYITNRIIKLRNTFQELNVLNLNEGDSLLLYETEGIYESEHIGEKMEIGVAAVTDLSPRGWSNRQQADEKITVVLSEPVYQKMIGLRRINPDEEIVNIKYLFVSLQKNANSDKVSGQMFEMLNEIDGGGYGIYDAASMRQSQDRVVMLIGVFVYGFITLITAISIANIFNTISTSVMLRKREFAMLKSVGMTTEGFRSMIRYESILYGVKALVYGIPVSILAIYAMYFALQSHFTFNFTLPVTSFLITAIAVFMIIALSMTYSWHKVRYENIVDALKEENI